MLITCLDYIIDEYYYKLFNNKLNFILKKNLIIMCECYQYKNSKSKAINFLEVPVYLNSTSSNHYPLTYTSNFKCQ